jgi:hypothetical protein
MVIANLITVLDKVFNSRTNLISMGIQEINIEEITQECIKNVFRTNTNEVGFIHLDFGKNNALSI